MRTRITLAAFAAVALSLALVGPASAAHLGNSKTELNGTGDPDATGTALVNYSDGTGLFNGQAKVQNLAAGQFYTYLVRRANGTEVKICDGLANKQGSFSCTGEQVAVPPPGFTGAVIRDMFGMEVAFGAFTPDERRGNCREPDQAGSLCTAPGQTG